MRIRSVLSDVINYSMSDEPPEELHLSEDKFDTLLVELNRFSFLSKEGRIELKINGISIKLGDKECPLH